MKLNVPVLRAQTEHRMHELAAKLLDLDKQWHARLQMLQLQGTTEFHVNNDVILKQLGGATKVVSDMLAGMAAYISATRE